jgi:P27 family predicted phage terminase small subunit
MAGRKPKPDALKVLTGTDQPVRMNGNAPAFGKITKLPSYPSYLNKGGKKIYKDIAASLAIAGILNSINIQMLIMYCHHLGVHYEAEKNLGDVEFRIHEMSSKNGDTYTQAKAMHKISQDALKSAKMLATEFGITPSAQARLRITPKEEQDPFQQFLTAK